MEKTIERKPEMSPTPLVALVGLLNEKENARFLAADRSTSAAGGILACAWAGFAACSLAQLRSLTPVAVDLSVSQNGDLGIEARIGCNGMLTTCLLLQRASYSLTRQIRLVACHIPNCLKVEVAGCQ